MPPTPHKYSFGSPLGILVLSLVFFVTAVLLCLALAFELIPGYPDPVNKNVPIYYQTGPASADLAVYLHPPLNAIQANGQSQFLAFQFTNRGASAIAIHGIDLFSAGCFRMDPQDPTAPPQPASGSSGASLPALRSIDPGQSLLLWYRLDPVEHSDTCPGQSPLVFRYTWQQLGAPPGKAPPLEQQSISTGPIRLATPADLHWQRFFSLLGRSVALILLPVLLAIGNYLLQDIQSRKAADQKRMDDVREAGERRIEAERASLQKLQEQKLEVWKAMIPGFVQAIREHYVPILRILTILADEAAHGPAEADLKNILACAMLFRLRITYLVDKNGGFFSRNHRGETLCATLANSFLERCYKLFGDRHTFLLTASALNPLDSITQIRQALQLDALAPEPFASHCATFMETLGQPQPLAELRAHASFLADTLDYEVNDPFYPLWYNTAPEPLKIEDLRGYLKAMHLAPGQEANLSRQLEEYLATLATDPKVL